MGFFRQEYWSGLPFPFPGDPLGLALGSPIFPSGCEGKLGVALESLQGLRDLTYKAPALQAKKQAEVGVLEIL